MRKGFDWSNLRIPIIHFICVNVESRNEIDVPCSLIARFNKISNIAISNIFLHYRYQVYLYVIYDVNSLNWGFKPIKGYNPPIFFRAT